MMPCKGILLFFFSVLTSQVFSQDYNFRNFSSEDGLTQSYVYTIIQDVHGYLWVGTDNGLFRYDGFKFQNYLTGDSLADNFITCGIGDGDGLWFGHKNGRLSYFNGKKFLPVNNTQPDLSSITHFAKSQDNQIWVSSYSDGLLKLSKDKGVIKQYKFKDQTIIISFDFFDNTELLVGTNSGLLYCRLKESGEIEIIRSVSEIPESKVTCIQKMRNNSGFYIASEDDGIFHLTNNDNLIKVTKIIADMDFDFSGIQDIYEDKLSNLWLCSKRNGLIKMSFSASGKSGKITNFNKADRFVTDNVNTVFEDREGNIWSGNYGHGLTLITPKIFSVRKFDNPLFGSNIFSICLNRQYGWIGTENGLVKIDQLTGKFIKFYGKESGLPEDTVTTIYSGDGKELWIGTERNGVFRMDVSKENIRKYPIRNGTLENSVTIITGKGDQVWIGTKKGLCNINTATDSIKLYSINQGGLPHNHINCLYLDRTDKLWISTSSNTLAYIQNEKIHKLPVNYAGILTLGPIAEDADSRIWVGSYGNGVYLIESDSISNLTAREGLLSNFCYSLFSDNHKNIWAGHKDGLSKIRTSDYSVKPIRHFEDISDSYKFSTNAVAIDQRGKIWFGSDKGIVKYDPLMDSSRAVPPVLGFTAVRINDTEREISDRIILSPGIYKIRIDFLGIILKEPELVTYQYKLEGYDQWSETTKNTFISFPRLTEGNYTFVLKALSGDDAVSENSLTMNIIIKKPVWKKWWFYTSSILLLIILTYIYVKRREHKFLVEKKILEEKVVERTYEIQCQKNEIELQRDLINEKNASITSSIVYASHIQNAVLPPLELLDKLLPDNFVLSRPKDIVSGDFYWLAEKNNKIIFTVGDCTGHGVPGAFMSLLGITLLNQIVNTEGITKSNAIVTKLRKRVIHLLKQSRKDIPTMDGIDIAVCVLDQQTNRIQYTGGMSDLVYIHNGKLQVIKADRLSVCVLDGNTGPFTMKEIKYAKGDVLYLFSDGYKDQFGGEYDKKFLAKHFHLTLLEIHKLPMFDQKEILERKLKGWMKDTIQTDDITVMGIRL
jgi:ligand-binding sensor domain-containing protein/serine phosphatase RsbU (regulator of sigma subunit)